MRILVINLGATSSKIAVFEDDKEVLTRSVAHNREELNALDTTQTQKRFREDVILRALKESGENPAGFDAVISRGGPLKPVESGTYLVAPVVSGRSRLKAQPGRYQDQLIRHFDRTHEGLRLWYSQGDLHRDRDVLP